MNRETKRAMAKQQRTATDQADRGRQLRRQQVARQQQAASTKTQPTERKRFRGFRRIVDYLRDVAAELRKVNWPDRRTVAGYTVVVLVAVSILTALIFGFDYLFGQAVVAVFT
jgi:preprotein translocase subunit SecE